VRSQGGLALTASKILRSLKKDASAGAKRNFSVRQRDAKMRRLNAKVAKFGRFLNRGRGRAFIQAVDCIAGRVNQLDLDPLDLERLRDGLERVIDSPISPEVFRLVFVVAAGLWAEERDDNGQRGVMGAAKVAGIARTTFLLHFADYLPRRTECRSATGCLRVPRFHHR
jgi:hypothetical protein